MIRRFGGVAGAAVAALVVSALVTSASAQQAYPARPLTLIVPFAAITGFVDPAVNFALQFQAQGDDSAPVDHAENDPPAAEPIEDGSNVVAVDFKRKK